MAKAKERLTRATLIRKQWAPVAFWCALLCVLAPLAQCSPHIYPAPKERGQKWGIAAEHEDVTLLSAIGGSSEYPAWSPDGTRIAFQHTKVRSHPTNYLAPRDIYVIESDGTAECCLTCQAEKGIQCKHPSWAPDSQGLLASCTMGYDYDLYVIDVNANILSRLTDYIGDEQYPAWSPDGTQSLFLSRMDIETNHRRARGYNLYTVTSEGANLSRLAGGAEYGRANWSSDGQQISATLSKDSFSAPRLCIVDAPGLEMTCDDSVHCIDVAWSPDGSQIACMTRSAILAVSVEDKRIDTLLDVGGRIISGISWSPDGTRIVFSAGGSFGVANDLYVLEVEP